MLSDKIGSLCKRQIKCEINGGINHLWSKKETLWEKGENDGTCIFFFFHHAFTRYLPNRSVKCSPKSKSKCVISVGNKRFKYWDTFIENIYSRSSLGPLWLKSKMYDSKCLGAGSNLTRRPGLFVWLSSGKILQNLSSVLMKYET